ncbi:MAG: hypothetical protein ABR936_16255 [Bacteroidota bacterium]|jgi:hypothetical protein
MAKKRTLSNHNIAQILLHYRDACLHNKESEEHQSEQRMKFFLGLVTATLALLSFLYKEKYFPAYQDIITIVSLFILFLFGLLTFSKIIWRSREIDKNNQTISDLDKSIISLDSYIEKGIMEAGKKVKEPSVFFLRAVKGTLAQFMYLTECLLASGIVLTAGIKWCFTNYLLVAIPVIAIIVFILMYSWSQYIRKLPFE